MALSTKEGQRTLPHKNKTGTQGICAVCNQYCWRNDFTKTQWDKQKQRDGNVPRTCNNCLKKASVDDFLNGDVISNADGYSANNLTRPARPSHFRSETSLDALLDRTPDQDSGQSQGARNQELDVWWVARRNRAEKRKRGEDDTQD